MITAGQTGSDPKARLQVPTIAELCESAQGYPQHALLLLDARLDRGGGAGEEPGLSARGFARLAQAFCGIRIADPAQAEFWDLAAGHPDVFVADRARAQLRREELERLFTLAPYPPSQGWRRLFFIDRCERLTPAAANALLKLLEEPAVPSLFVLTASRRAEVLPTILSRCQRLSVRLGETQADGSGSFPQDAESAVPLARLRRVLLAAAERAEAEGDPTPYDPDREGPVPTASQVAELLDCAEELGRLHEAETLRGVVVSLAAEICQKGAMAQSLARFILREVREWKDVEPYHPKSALWLLRILLLAG